MIQIELKRLLKESIIIFAILMALMVHILTTSKDTVNASIILEIFLLVFASYTGWSMFERERQENATEYLLSMPVSRGRLFVMKFLPRLLAVMLVLAGYMLMHQFYVFPSYLTPGHVAGIYFIFFMVSLSFSIWMKNFIGALFITAFITSGLLLLMEWRLEQMSLSGAVLTAGIILMVFPVTFYIVFHRYDIRSSGTFNLRSVPVPFVVLAIAAAAVWFLGGVHYWNYYLLNNGDLLRSSCGDKKSQWLRPPVGKGEVKDYNFSILPLLEGEGMLYAQVREHRGDSCVPLRITETNLKTRDSRTLMKFEEGWNMRHTGVGYNGILNNGYYYNLLYNYESKQYKIIKLPVGASAEQRRMEKIQVVGNVQGTYYYNLFHMVEEPLQFFFYTHRSLYRVVCAPEQQGVRVGEAIEIGEDFRRVSAWKNRLAVFDHKGMTLYEAGEQLKPIMHKKKVKKVKLRFGSQVSRFLLLHKSKHVFIFDMKESTFQPLEMSSFPYYSNFSNGTPYFLWVKDKLLIYGRLENGKIKKVKKETTKFDDVHLIRTFPGGVVINDRNTYQLVKYNHGTQ